MLGRIPQNEWWLIGQFKVAEHRDIRVEVDCCSVVVDTIVVATGVNRVDIGPALHWSPALTDEGAIRIVSRVR